MTSPTSRSLALYRKRGWLVAVVERFNPYAKVRQDLFGFIDLIAIKGDLTLGIQTTTGDHVAERIEKVKGLQAAAVWLESPLRKIVFNGWRKVGARGERKLWQCREVTMDKDGMVSEFVPDGELPGL